MRIEPLVSLVLPIAVPVVGVGVGVGEGSVAEGGSEDVQERIDSIGVGERGSMELTRRKENVAFQLVHRRNDHRDDQREDEEEGEEGQTRRHSAEHD